MANVKENKEEKRVIPNKNYIIVAVIFIATIGLMFFLRNWYISYQDYENTIPVLSGVISEVRYNEIDNYLSDNPSVVIYMGDAKDYDCREFELELKELLESKQIKDRVIYYNITDVKNKNLLLKEFNNKYALNNKISSYPVIVIFEDGKIVDYKSKTASKNLTISDINLLFNEYDVYGE